MQLVADMLHVLPAVLQLNLCLLVLSVPVGKADRGNEGHYPCLHLQVRGKAQSMLLQVKTPPPQVQNSSW